jgi:signal transduction histidine kinase/ActR/RegA family two-component response regulator
LKRARGTSEADRLDAGELSNLRLEQARMLKQRVLGSCLIVEFIIAYTAVIMAVVSSPAIAAGWFAAGTAMVIVAYLYGRFAARDGINRRNYAKFLKGHRVVSALTGLVWGGYAIFQLDYSSEFTIFLGCLTVCSITLGGVFPSSAYRATYIALATTAIPPLGFYIAVTAPGALRLVGVGLLVYYLFAMFISARVEIDTRETLAARNARMLNERIVGQNRLYLEASEEKTRFLAATSHDLSQPLQSQGFFIRALRDHLDRPDQIDLLDRVEEAWRAQKDLLQGIVDVSRIDSGAIVPRIVTVDLASECARLAEEFPLDPGKAKLADVHFAPVVVETDPLLVARILRNLLSNARQYTPADGRISFTVASEGDHALVSVADTGPGIAEEDRERIFAEYVRLEGGTRETQGLGLGLSIVRRLCQLLEIDLALDSAPGRGTRFELRLPISAPAAAAPASSATARSDFTGTPLVVLVDDDAAVVEAMATVLSGWKCKLITAHSSVEALELIALTPDIPALLLIDKRLGPGDDGAVLIEAIREECNEQIPAILMSGNLGKLAGFDEDEGLVYLNKPVEPEDLRIAMRDLLQAHAGGVARGSENAE